MAAPTVLIYRRDLLPNSETFIKRQIKAMHRWHGVLVGQPMSNGLPLDGIPICPVRMPNPADPISSTMMGRLLSRRLRRLVRRSKRCELEPYARAKATAVQLKKRPWFKSVSAIEGKLLHVHFGTNAQEAWPLAMALKIPMLVTLHGYDAAIHQTWWESGHGGRTYKQYPGALRAMADWGAQFVAVSSAIATDADRCGLPASSVRTILTGIDTKAFAAGTVPISARARRILFVGRFVEKKGVEYLLRAFRDVKYTVPDAQLRIIGGGPLEEPLKRLAEEMNINAEFVGWLPEREVLLEMHEARVLCVPSVRAANGDGEGLPTVIPEAQASGLPVVTSARGGTSEGIIHGITGIAVAERDTAALARALEHALTDDEFANSAGTAATKFAKERLDISVHVKKLESLYDELSETRRPEPLKSVSAALL